MMNRMVSAWLPVFSVVTFPLVTSVAYPATNAPVEQTLDVLTVDMDPGQGDPGQGPEMMKTYLSGKLHEAEAAWRAAYDARTTPEQITAYQQRLQAEFISRIGGFPERTPLNARTVGTLVRKGYRIEKIILESRPKHFVTAALFLPDPKRFPPPYPGVVVPCGHSDDGKGCPAYATFCALAATNGLATIIFDPIDQGERHQWQDETGKFHLYCTSGHNMIGASSILLGRNTAGFEIWDGIRVIDYLQSRDDIDPQQIGCSGNSGGGTQTAYLMALDDRIRAAAPSCFLCGLFGRLLHENGAQDAEQNIFGQLAIGMDHADYCMMRAPRPTLLLAATHDFFNINDTWSLFRRAKRLYGRLGYGDRMCLVETGEKHGFTVRLREASVRWMTRWLAGRDIAIVEPADLDVPSKSDLQCTPDGEVMLLAGARSVYDLNRAYNRELAQRRQKLWKTTPREEMLRRVADAAGIRHPIDSDVPKTISKGVVERDGWTMEKLVLRPEKGIALPALYFVPNDQRPTAAVVYAHENGKAADAGPNGPIEQLVQSGRAVLAVDLRGTGATQRTGQRYFTPDLHGPDGQDVYVAYLLGRSYVGMRTEDLLACARFLQAKHGTDSRIELVTIGYLGSSALHAAALQPPLFSAVKLVRPLISWANVVELGYSKNRLANTVHGALVQYDLPDLARVVGEKLIMEDAQDGMNRPYKEATPSERPTTSAPSQKR